MTTLYKKDGSEYYEWSSGSTHLQVDQLVGKHNLLISVKCSFGDSEDKHYALFDTGAEWTVVPQSLADNYPDDFISLESPVRISTRLGSNQGVLHRCSIRILVDKGADISTEITVLVIPDWYGPLVIGFRTFLEKIRWACDPTIDQQGRLYFGVAEEY